MTKTASVQPKAPRVDECVCYPTDPVMDKRYVGVIADGHRVSNGD
jgi:hypothetical protein